MELKNKKTSITIAVLCLSLFIVLTGVWGERKQEDNTYYDINEGWDIKKSEGSYYDADITKTDISLGDAGERVILSKKLNTVIDNPMLVFMVYHCAVRIYDDSELIYEYGMEELKNNGTLGSGTHHVRLPDDYVGKNLIISFKSNIDKPYSDFGGIMLVDESKYFSSYIQGNMLGVVTSFIMVVIGIVSIIAMIFFGKNNTSYRKIYYIGGTSLLLGIWIQCYFGYIQLYTDDLLLSVYLENICLFMLPVPITMYMYESIENGKLKEILKYIVVISTTYSFAAFVFNMSGIIKFKKMVPPFHVFALFCIVVIVISAFSDKISNVKARIAISVGIIFLAISLSIELIIYNISQLYNQRITSFSMVSLGGLLYISCMLISYIFFFEENIEKNAKDKALAQLAYTDSLTGVYNRQMCEKKMTDIDNGNVKNYAIINFDLNWLKRINDNLGHSFGDKYLMEFTRILTDTITDRSDMVGRMGGDEFIAILVNKDEKYVKDIINKLNKKSGNGNIPETRKEGDGVSFAYGWAVSNGDKPLTTHRAYEIADNNMYECKAAQKVGRK